MVEENGHGLGRLPLPRDDRDFLVSEMPSTEPLLAARTRRLWGMHKLTLNQGATGTCEGNGWTHWLVDQPVVHVDIPELVGDPPDVNVAEQWARDLYVEATGDTSLQQGAYTRDLVKTLVNRGLVGAYYRAATVDDVIDCLLHRGPVCMGYNWYHSMDHLEFEFGKHWIKVDEASGVRGGHLTVFDAIDLAPDDGSPPWVRDHNSWDYGWGDNGRAHITIPEFQMLFVGDAWICTEVGA